jgi:hypothetical protein
MSHAAAEIEHRMLMPFVPKASIRPVQSYVASTKLRSFVWSDMC